MKYIRMAILALTVLACLWIAVPNLFEIQQPAAYTEAETSPSPQPAPTPDYGQIAPEVSPAPAVQNTPVPSQEPLQEETVQRGGPSYMMDLWLDASPNIAGFSPFDDSTNRKEYGQWTGGFFYKVKKNSDVVQQGWLLSILKRTYGKEMVGQGSVRVLRYGAESVLAQQQLEALTEEFGVDRDALIRDTLTYEVLSDNSKDRSLFFEDLFQVKGSLSPGATNPFEVLDCFFTQNEPELHNRTIMDENDKDQQGWNWTRETENSDALVRAWEEVNAAFAGYDARIRSSAPSSENFEEGSAAQEDYLYYALSAMDPSHLNVLFADTLSLPEIDSYSQMYAQCIAHKAEENNGDLAVGFVGLQLDYAGKISNVGGQSFHTGFLWGFEDFGYRNKDRNSFVWNHIQPMPRPLLMLVAGPSETVHSYMGKFCEVLNTEMQSSGMLSQLRGEKGAAVESDHYENTPVYRYGGEACLAPQFSFSYQTAVMEAIDVVAMQSELLSVLSGRLETSGSALSFSSGEEPLETAAYAYETVVGAQTNRQDVPVVETAFSTPLTLSLDLELQAGESISESQYDASLVIAGAFKTHSFEIQEISALEQAGELNLGAGSEILEDQAYIDDSGRIYKYHVYCSPDGEALISGAEAGLDLQDIHPVVEDGRLVVTLKANTPPDPGYYWMTLQLSSRPLAELENEEWNHIAPWMQGEAEPSFDAAAGPAVLAAQGGSWDYTPNNYDLKTFKDIDVRSAADNDLIAVRDVYNGLGRSIHHAWGTQTVEPNSLFPADIPPVFRIFQLNRLAESLRSGLLDRSGEIGAAPFLTRHFIICVPEPETAGEV